LYVSWDDWTGGHDYYGSCQCQSGEEPVNSSHWYVACEEVEAVLDDADGVLNVPDEYATIQEALDASSDGDTINISEGTYFESGLTVYPASGVITIIGATNPDGTPAVTIDAQFNDVVFDCSTNSTFENLVITRGSSNKQPSNGGGMFIENASPMLTNCTITNNTAMNGGGIFNDVNSSTTLTNCTLSNNGAVYWQQDNTGQGGGISNSSNSTVTLVNTTISGNSATWGGAICNQGNSLSSLSGCTVSNNIGKISGGGIYSVMSSATLQDTTFCANSPTHLIGAWNDLGGNSFSDECDLGGPAFCAGDVNEDYDVDVLDLLYIIAVYNTDNPAGDLNGDGWVNVADLLLLIGGWGACP